MVQNKRLFIGGLPWATTDDELKKTFAGAGTVTSAMVHRDKMTGRSSGFGFVEMSSLEEADKAIEMFNGKDFGGRVIKVDEARPSPRRFERAQ
jgi:RNA recognition motif-containing protein